MYANADIIIIVLGFLVSTVYEYSYYDGRPQISTVATVVGRSPLENQKICFGLYCGPFLLLFFDMESFLLRLFSLCGAFLTMWGPFCYFFLHGGGFFGLAPTPPHPPTKIAAGAHGYIIYYNTIDISLKKNWIFVEEWGAKCNFAPEGQLPSLRHWNRQNLNF